MNSLISKITSAGIRIKTDGETLTVEGDAPLPDDLRDEIRTNKAEIIRILSVSPESPLPALESPPGKAEPSEKKNVPQDPPEPKAPNIRPCFVCGGRKFWTRGGGLPVLCGKCYPPAVPRGVLWIESEMPEPTREHDDYFRCLSSWLSALDIPEGLRISAAVKILDATRFKATLIADLELGKYSARWMTGALLRDLENLAHVLRLRIPVETDRSELNDETRKENIEGCRLHRRRAGGLCDPYTSAA